MAFGSNCAIPIVTNENQSMNYKWMASIGVFVACAGLVGLMMNAVLPGSIAIGVGLTSALTALVGSWWNDE